MHELKERLSHLVQSLEKKVPYACALYKKSSGTRLSVNRFQESIESEDPARGLVVTLWNGDRFFEYAVNRWDWPALSEELSRVASHAASLAPKKKLSDIDPGPATVTNFVSPVQTRPDSVPLRDRLEGLRASVKSTLALSKNVSNVITLQGHVLHEDVFVNRTKAMSQTILRSDNIVVVYVSDGKTTADVHGGLSKNGGLEAVQFPSDLVPGLVADAERLLTAKRLTPGVYDVVTDPEWSGIIAHECFGHGMETDLYVRERALSQKYIGKPVASPIVNMFDDPSIIQEAGGFYFDDEGQLSSPTHIIKNGVLQRGLTDLASAHKLKLTRSANGRRESYARKAYARMTNTFFASGAHTKDHMIASVKNGLYLRHATNGMEDPQAWGIQVEGLWAEEIKNGKLTGTVYSPVIMTGFVPDLLKSISMVGNDGFISGLGMCGKGHKEWVKNTTGGPHLKMKARLA
jgi:TldD protein